MLYILRFGQLGAYKVGNMFDGFFCFGQQWLVGLEYVEHASPDFECHLDAIVSCLFCHTDTIVTEHFVFADLNQQRRNASIVAKDG